MTKIQQVIRSGAASLAIAVAMGAAATAQAQQSTENVPTSPQAEEGTPIVVTGSRIRRDPLSQDAPITFVDQDDIAKTGLNSINDVLQRLPSSGGGLNSKFNNSGNLGNPPDGGGVGAGAAEIDLRYLGSRRVLVLVDGLRFVNGASASGVPGSTDLNSIPESAIERIEVLQTVPRQFTVRTQLRVSSTSSPNAGRRALRARRNWAGTKRAMALPRITSSAGAMAATVRFRSSRAQAM